MRIHLTILRGVLFVASLLVSAHFSQAQDWEFKSYTVYGTGGYWELGETVRIDCSYKSGRFSYERKMTLSDNQMNVYKSTADFFTPEKTYSPGDDVIIRIQFSETGKRMGYIPYARVTVMTGNVSWAKTSGPSRKVPSSGYASGQAVDASGRNVVTPPETVTLMGRAPKTGQEMAIVLTCNGMEVVYQYERKQPGVSNVSGSNVQSSSTSGATPAQTEKSTPVDEPAGGITTGEIDSLGIEYDEFEGGEPDIIDPDIVESKLPWAKIGLGVLALAIVVGVVLASSRGKKPAATPPVAPASPAAPPAPPVAPSAPSVVRYCKNCGKKADGQERFCTECGHPLW